jgi:hypothetical protein
VWRLFDPKPCAEKSRAPERQAKRPSFIAKPFKTLLKVRRANGTEIILGFDGSVSWSVTPQGASIDKDTALEAVRRDADLQDALHQPDYFQKLDFAGATDFEGGRIVGVIADFNSSDAYHDRR